MINVFFDMDGTLIDSANAISCAVNEIRNELNLSPLSREKIMQTINTPNVDWAKELYTIILALKMVLKNISSNTMSKAWFYLKGLKKYWNF